MSRANQEDIDWVRNQLPSIGNPIELTDRIDALERRMASNTLSVAVFGEFSSGKSTLLNALLGYELLPTSALVTTSVNTVLHPGSTWTGFEIDTDTRRTFRSVDGSFRAWYRQTLGAEPPERDVDMLRALMTDEPTAQSITALRVHHRSHLFVDDVEIIDTPGFNSTDTRHRGLAEKVALKADLAVVLVPATSPVSTTLAEFITGTLDDYHERCVFILTKGRHVEDKEELARTAATRLAELGFQNVLLRADATDVALANLDPQRPAPSEADDVDPHDAVQDLTTLATQLGEHARQGREHFIGRNTARILRDLLRAVSEASSERRDALEANRARLDALQITSLDDLLDTWTDDARDDARQAARAAAHKAAKSRKPKAINTALQEALGKLGTSNQKEAITRFQADLDGALEDWVRHQIAQIALDTRRALRVSGNQLQRLVEQEYADLQNEVGVSEKRITIDVKIPTPAVPALKADLSEVNKRVQDAEGLSGGEATALGWGAALTAAAFLGPVGLLAGLVGPFMKKRTVPRAEVEEALKPIIASCVSSARDVIRRADQVVLSSANSTIEGIADLYQDAYGPSVDELIAQNERHRDSLRSDLETTIETIDEATRRLSRLPS